MALDAPTQLTQPSLMSGNLWANAAFGVGVASVFTVALHVTEFKLKIRLGLVRSL